MQSQNVFMKIQYQEFGEQYVWNTTVTSGLTFEWWLFSLVYCLLLSRYCLVIVKRNCFTG